MPCGQRRGLAGGSHRLNTFIPSVADHQSSQLQHRLRVFFTPEDSIPFESQIDDSTNAAFDRATAERKSNGREMSDMPVDPRHRDAAGS